MNRARLGTTQSSAALACLSRNVKKLGGGRARRYTSQVRALAPSSALVSFAGTALVGLLFSCSVPTSEAGEPAAVTFAGFQAFPDRTSRIYVHVTRQPPLDVVKQELGIVFTLRDTRVLARNNQNPLDLEHFVTPAKRARFVPSGSDVRFEIELKRPTEERHRFAANPGGGSSLQIDFPAVD